MKRIQLSDHIVKLEYNFGLKISVWLVKHRNGVTLVDTGVGLMKKSILKNIQREGELTRIALTHGHPDHIGALNAILKEHPVPVFLHRREIPYVRGEKPFPNKKKAQKPSGVGQLHAFDDRFTEKTGLRVHHTPGHSPGHVALYHKEDNVLIAGDAFMSKKGELTNPIAVFTANMEEAVQSGRNVLEQVEPEVVTICHGQDVTLRA